MKRSQKLECEVFSECVAGGLSNLWGSIDDAIEAFRLRLSGGVETAWPLPPECDESESPVREVDYTMDDPGPEHLPGPVLRGWIRERA